MGGQHTTSSIPGREKARTRWPRLLLSALTAFTAALCLGSACEPSPPACGAAPCDPGQVRTLQDLCVTPKAPGAECSTPLLGADVCAPGFACVSGTCQAAPGLGQVCSPGEPCAFSFASERPSYCPPAGCQPVPRCSDYANIFQNCDSNASAPGCNPCEPGLVCFDGKCAKHCETDATCPCDPGGAPGHCDLSTPGGTVCTACEPLGQSCDGFLKKCCNADEACGPDATCCRVQGAGCATNLQCCGTDRCVSDTCIACHPSGQSCDQDNECCTGACRNGACVQCVGTGSGCGTNNLFCCSAGDICGGDGTCCKPAGTACASSSQCCGTDVCVGSACQACKSSGASCGGSAECCAGTTCNGGKCSVPCTPGGACTVPGAKGICAAGVVECTRSGPTCKQVVQPSAETCNGKDDNCNGLVDDGIASTDCTNPTNLNCQSGFSGPGKTACIAGQTVCQANVCGQGDDPATCVCTGCTNGPPCGFCANQPCNGNCIPNFLCSGPTQPLECVANTKQCAQPGAHVACWTGDEAGTCIP